MAYTKQTWINDDLTKPLSASRMGHIEDGIEAAQATVDAIVVPETKADIGLANVDNTADTTKNVLSATKLTTSRTINGVGFDGTANITVADSTKVPTTRTVAGYALTGNITPGGIKTALVLVKADVGLGSVDNTTDAAKPISTATQSALDAKISGTGVTNIVALTQAAYDALTPNSTTLYVING